MVEWGGGGSDYRCSINIPHKSRASGPEDSQMRGHTPINQVTLILFKQEMRLSSLHPNKVRCNEWLLFRRRNGYT